MRPITHAVLGAFLFVAPVVAGEPDWLVERSDTSSLLLPTLGDSLSSPRLALGYPLGQRFSRHDEILDYFENLAAGSSRLALWEYGRTYEDRPLTLVAISSPENIARLEELRERQLRLAQPDGLTTGELDLLEQDAPIFVWLAYGIHGNEASSSETAMAAAFVLASAEGSWTSLLEDVVILIDPLVNPDGRERYVHSFVATSGRVPDSFPGSAEHREPWPGGRQNHYLIDLNRDWAWATQRETRFRLREYRRWEPHVYVDFHEMSPRSTYFFPPSADPIHPGIDPSTIGWLGVFGDANAEAFDAQEWTYYVGENFDLFYPGYSDSYPSLRGAVGMTYEMAGHGRAGLAFERPDGSLLTLADRVARHLTTTLTTVETAVAHRGRIIRDFVAARRKAIDSDGPSYIWRADQGEATAAAALLREHGLIVKRLAEASTIEATPLLGTGPRRQSFAAGTYVMPGSQPLAALAESLMALNAQMPASFLTEQRKRLEQNRSTEFFDITAWSIPVAFNLEAFVVDGTVSGTTPDEPLTSALASEGEEALGFLVRPQGLATYRFISSLLAQDIPVRLSLAAFSQTGEDYPRGTLFIPAAGLDGDFDLLRSLAQEAGIEISRTTTALSQSGVSLGSDEIVRLRSPRVGLVGGAGVRATSFGFLWFLLDQMLEIPYHRLDLDSLGGVDLADFDAIILPGGAGYSSRLDDDAAADLGRWIESGGILIAIGGAVDWLQEHELTTIEKWKAPEEKEETPNSVSRVTPAGRSLYTPGAALSTVVQAQHPLTAGLEGSPATLFRGTTILLPTGNPRQDLVVATEEDPVVAGFVWPEAEERLRGSLLAGAERRGRGAVVVFSQEPFFRLFWRASTTPFLNALLYGPSLNDHRQLFQ